MQTNQAQYVKLVELLNRLNTKVFSMPLEKYIGIIIIMSLISKNYVLNDLPVLKNNYNLLLQWITKSLMTDSS